MLKVNKLRIEVFTTNGKYGTEISFNSGLNIIKANNTSGKSTCVQAILYGLGMEELIGGKGWKTMQSVLKDVVEDGNREYPVLESYVYLVISNKKTITVKRSVKSINRDHKLVDVYEGDYLNDKNIVSSSYYLFDPYSAQDIKYGFHAFLEDFLDWQLPKITGSNGNESKLYIQTIFPAFFIEQKAGWSDFLATIPYLGVKNVESRVIEFILNLDIAKYDAKKQDVRQRKYDIGHMWITLKERIDDLAISAGFRLNTFPVKPEIISNLESIKLLKYENHITYDLENYIYEKENEYKRIIIKEVPINENKVNDYEYRFKELEELIEDGTMLYEKLKSDISQEKEKIKYLSKQLLDIERDIHYNKIEIKLKSFGSTIDLKISNNVCPTCEQNIDQSLFPQYMKHKVMSAEENLDYLQAQDKMIKIYIGNSTKILNEKLLEQDNLWAVLKENRAELRSLKKMMIADDRLPSEAEIERKIIIRNQVSFYKKLEEKFIGLKDELKELVGAWEEVLKEEKAIPNDLQSQLDKDKIRNLQFVFRKLLIEFGYSSKDTTLISISRDKYLPAVNGLALKKGVILDSNSKQSYDIKYDSSASDFVRTIWAYTCSLYKVSKQFDANHPSLLVMDEPEQHSMSIDSIKNLFKEVSSYRNGQVIIAASFHNKENVFNEAVKDIDYHLIDLGRKAIKEL